MPPIPILPVWNDDLQTWQCPTCDSTAFCRTITLTNIQLVSPDKTTFHAADPETNWQPIADDGTLTCYACNQPLLPPPGITWNLPTDLYQRR